MNDKDLTQELLKIIDLAGSGAADKTPDTPVAFEGFDVWESVHTVSLVQNLKALIEAEIVEARLDEVLKVLPSVGLTGDVNAGQTITVEELWSALVKRKKTLQAQLKKKAGRE